MRRKRALGRDLTIPPVANPRRRRRCERDAALYLRTYFPHVFFNPFTTTHRSIIDGVAERIQYGGSKAEAAPRGEGKTSIARGLATCAINYGWRDFFVIVGANAIKAGDNLVSIRDEYEQNDLLAADFPEICIPIRALGGANQRAAAQTVDGARTYLKWTGDLIHMPVVAGSAASGRIITSVGIESGNIRGLLYRGRRPDFVLIDDPETEGSVDSETETARREKTIDRAITGMAGPNKKIAIFYTCTIWSPSSCAARYTDPKIKPAWAGARRRLLEKRPDREDLWEAYMDLRTGGVLTGDETGRAAAAFYLGRRRAMDKGAVVSNPFRFDPTQLADGTQLQISALQFCYDVIADHGWEAFNTEYQNEPPDDVAGEAIELTEAAVMTQCNGRPRGTVTPEADFLTAGLDVGARAIHWVVKDWKHGAGSIVDYDVIPVHSPMLGGVEDPENVQAVQEAILAALLEFRAMAAIGWPDADTGEGRQLDKAFIDCGYAREGMDTPIWELVRNTPGRLYCAAKGFGSGSGQSSYRQPTKGGSGKRIFNHCFSTWQPKRKARLYHVDADYWKLFVQTAFLTPPGRPGSLTLPGLLADAVRHKQFARQITAEIWTPEFRPGRGYRWKWNRRRQANHLLDACANAAAAAGTVGLKTVGNPKPEPTPDGKPAPRKPPAGQMAVSLSDLYKKPKGPRR